jgi:endonuclease/exonuclease/phosphatase family metal-dependent hydrolase
MTGRQGGSFARRQARGCAIGSVLVAGRAWVVLALLLLSIPAAAAELKIATWNLNWLTIREAGSPGLPPDLHIRSPADFDRLRDYATELNADVVAVQEVDGYEAIRRVFPADLYHLVMSRDRITQRVGIAIRRGIRYDPHPDVPLGPDLNTRLRSGVDVTLTTPSGNLRLLAVHLKQGCQNPKLDRAQGRDCQTLFGQASQLRTWIRERSAAGEAFVVLGDFNRWMDKRDPFIAQLRESAPLTRATEGFASPCWGAETFIDHILAGGPARDWMRPETMLVLKYRESGPEWKSRLSDHCPLSVRFILPEP